MKKIVIIDGNSVLFRAFYATFNPTMPIMRNKDGIPTNAVFAFSNMINKIISTFDGDEHLLVAFDTGKKTFRHEELETYKAQRKKAPEELVIQMPLAREYLSAMGVFTYELDGFEGDDIAGTVAVMAANLNYKVEIYTSDRDFLQLINDNITIRIIKRGLSDIVDMTPSTLFETYGLLPHQIPDYKGLMGDASDNLQGIPGVGEKTAVKLITQFGDLENIIKESANQKGKVYESIIVNQDSGRLCKRLAMIKTDIVLPFSVEDTLYLGYDFQRLSSFCAQYELKQLMNKLNSKKANVSSKKEDIEFAIISSTKNIDLENDVGIALDMDNSNYNFAKIKGLALAQKSGNYYIKTDDLKSDSKLLKHLANKNIKKYCYDFKALCVALKKIGISIDGLHFDLLIASYVLDSSLSNDVNSIFNYYSISLSKENTESLNLFESEDNAKRFVEIAYYALHLFDDVMTSLKKSEGIDLFNNIEIPLVSVLANMEIEGFPLNKEKLLEIGEQYRHKLEQVSSEIYDLAGEKFNIASPKQVGELLFNKLKINSPTKKLSTSVDVLKKIAHEHEIVEKILEHRKYAKLLSTYVDGLVTHIHDDGKLHPLFNQALTQTGRLSSSEPNIQNISIRDEEGRQIRQAFYYPNNSLNILSLDYSQIELRVLASMSNCERLIEAFNNDDDIHELTAKYVFHKNEVTSNERRLAKAVNFGIVYGISDWGLAEQLEISPFEAREIIKRFYETYPEILTYMKQVAENAEKTGYVKTLLGRIRYIREFHDANYQVREFAKRAAVNAPIQGTAADIIKIAMINIALVLEDKSLKTKMVLQIHDELIFEVPDDELEIVEPIIKELMENAVKLKCNLKVDGGHAKTWYNAK